MSRTFFELLKIMSAMIIPVVLGMFLNYFGMLKPDYKSIGVLVANYVIVYAVSV